jgi:PhnB protein
LDDGMNDSDYRPSGYSSLTPYLVVSPAAEAIAFYVDVFGATVVSRLDGPARAGGEPFVGQAELDFGSGRLQLSDPMPAFGLVAPPRDADGVSGSTVLYVGDVDAVYAKAVAAGATVREELNDFVSGDRYASIVDPFGHRWAIMTRRPGVSDEQSAAAVEAWWAQASAQIAPDL